MERKVWSHPNKGILYPNQYIVLVGPPGTGKSQIISRVEYFLRKVPGVHVAPSSVTTASLVDTLVASECTFLNPVFVKYNSSQVVASEFQNFLPAYETSFMGMLTKFYDCETYEERRRTGKNPHIRIDFTQLSILAGTTPSYLNTLLPEGAWDQGFTSRTIFIYAEKSRAGGNPFAEKDLQEERELTEDMENDLKNIYLQKGQMFWEREVQIALGNWIAGGEQPVPEHNRLLHYNSRRSAHIIKLGMIARMARTNEGKVSMEDLDTAMSWLLEAESFMPDIFRSMATTPESRSMEDAKFFISQIFAKIKRPVPEHYLLDFLKHREKPQNIQKMIDLMVRSRMLKHTYDSNGNSFYTPTSLS